MSISARDLTGLSRASLTKWAMSDAPGQGVLPALEVGLKATADLDTGEVFDLGS